MGESKKDALRVNFDRKLKLEFRLCRTFNRSGSDGKHCPAGGIVRTVDETKTTLGCRKERIFKPVGRK